MEEYINTCLVCQQDKEDNRMQANPLQPLLIMSKETLGKYLYGIHHLDNSFTRIQWDLGFLWFLTYFPSILSLC